jgi:putative two-component system response regulator
MFKSRSDQKYQELNESLVRLAYIAELKEWDNRKHLERFRNYTMILASSLGLSRDEVTIVSIASQVHDVGKVFTPEELLKRSGNFEADEWKTIEKHTLQGAKVLESTASIVLQTGSAIALTHHERWDGSGYPRHLQKEEIPFSGRICAVVDVFDALTSKRGYKELISDEEALRLIKESSGTLFDPQIVKIFEAQFAEIRKIKNTFA